MFGWRRRNEGFEWREYVRTTILARRARRRQKLEEAKNVAVEGLKEAGRRGVAAGASGLDALLEKMKDAVRRAGAAGVSLLWAVGRAGGSVLRWLAAAADHLARRSVQLMAPAGRALGRRIEPLLVLLGQRDLRMVIAIVGAIAAAGSAARVFGPGLDREAGAALLIALASAALLWLPRLLGEGIVAWPSWPAWPALRLPVLAALAVLVVGGGGWLVAGQLWRLGGIVSVPLFGSPGVIEGHASAVTGDTLSLRGRTVRLAGIEAPELDQSCTYGGSRHWRCGQTAREALARLLRGGAVRCETSGEDQAGRVRATCRIEDRDIAAELVRRGHVFAETGLFARYGSVEREAQSSRAGLWRGEAERPAAYRAKRWEEAKRAAPDGCPIKGQISPDGRVYVLPWSPDYDRIKVRSARGERWFCSEAEARAAGWKPI